MSGLFSNKEKIDLNIVIYCKGANIKQKTIFWVFEVKKNIVKAQRTRGLSSAYQSNNTQILIKFQNSKSQPNISISTKL